MSARPLRFALPALCLLVACAAGPGPSAPPPTPAERASLQNECVKIADRSERQACLERAALGKD